MSRFNNILKNNSFQTHMKKLCEYEKDRIFCNHDIEHILSVARIMFIENIEKNLSINKDVIYATALLHDIGRVYQYENGTPHAIAGLEISKIILNECSYTDVEINIICSAIANHNNSNSNDQLSYLLKYADKISRNCFLCTAYKECNWSEEKKNKGVIS